MFVWWSYWMRVKSIGSEHAAAGLTGRAGGSDRRERRDPRSKPIVPEVRTAPVRRPARSRPPASRGRAVSGVGGEPGGHLAVFDRCVARGTLNPGSRTPATSSRRGAS
jgi:hypothetical protein